MVTKYKDLTSEDLKNLKRFYCIGYKDVGLDEQETEFLLSYRTKLYESMLYLWEAHAGNKEENTKKLLDGLTDVADMISVYMKSATSGNIRQRLLFVNNIKQEIETINTAIQWGLHKYSSDNAIHAQKIGVEITNFLKYICANTLIENNELSNMLSENLQLQVKSLKDKLKKKFLDYIDLDNISFYDNYLLIGCSLNQIEELSEKQFEIHKTKCEGCMVDDCALSRCNSHMQDIEYEREIKAYKKIVSMCGSRLSGKPIESEDIEKLQNIIKNEKVIIALSRLSVIPPIETRNDRVKKIEIQSLTRMPELIDSERIQEALVKFSSVPQDKEYYEDIDLIASSLLITRCDYREAKGNEITEGFFNWYKEVGKDINSENNSITYLGKLLRHYKEKHKEINKGEE